ncbi:Predicted metalloprotease [Geodermatophilus obscurus]|uniref:Predicted metalloprotease n=1 Tax=Geodermatophilus obscurus TaxID=1861 RepID=A0A1I5GQD0_9ACTN|nr:Predicted metalloprotease [Geodermatophilus obscurus]
MLLTGCASTVSGIASRGASVPEDVPADEFPITGAADNETDRLARNALADLDTFWSQAYPEYFGEEYQPLAGGYFSVDSTAIDESAYPEHGIGCDRAPTDPEEVANNAHYDPNCDVVAYDRALLEQLSAENGPYLGPAVMAHEIGHAMQNRFGYADSAIIVETQADCLAGAFTRWVVDGNAEHVSLRVAELDQVVLGFIGLSDPVGFDPDDQRAHGSGFDRMSGFFAGYEGGVGSCRDEFTEDRLFTATEFTTQDDLDNEGNAPYDEIGGIIGTTLPAFYESVFPGLGEQFTAPEVESFDGTAPACGDMGAEDRDLGYCEADGTVYVDESDLLAPAYEQIGDFAVATAVSLAYAQAARAQLGLSIDDAAAVDSAVCLTGWYAGRFWTGDYQAQDITISPGDVDEAAVFLLTYGQTEGVFPNTDLSGFEMVDAFRDGFLNGGAGCEIGL